jgi:hypothetical protein
MPLVTADTLRLRGINHVRTGAPKVFVSAILAQEITMPRTAQRAHRTVAAAKPKPQRAGGNGAVVDVAPQQDGWQQALDLTRAMFGASLGNPHDLMQGLAEWQATQAAWMQALQDMGALAEQAMQIGNRWIERSRADATRLSQHWLGNGWQPVPAAGVAEIADPDLPLAMLGQAQAAMTEVSRLWTQALYNTTLPD